MISVEEALRLVLQETIILPIEEVPMLQAVGRVLAKPVLADRDFPPFDRVTMDGVAIDMAAFTQGTRTFSIAHIQAAGAPQVTLENPAQCVEVMTGAMLPINANAVIPYEACQIEDQQAIIKAESVIRGQNIHPQGSDCVAGTTLLSPGSRITPAMVGTLATVGCASVPVYRLPKVAICSTGDELVDVDASPLPHQIRKSNVFMLAAAIQQENITAQLYHLPDNPNEMRIQLSTILEEHEVVLLSGAVSKGKFDYLPRVLDKLRFWPVFHKIAQKPGKPMMFGKMPGGQVIFGFPGNPVSTFVCYHLYFRPWLQKCLGLPLKPAMAQLAHVIPFKPALTYHVPVQLAQEEGMVKAMAVPTTGSGDLTSLLKADGLLTLPPDREQFLAGEVFPITYL